MGDFEKDFRDEELKLSFGDMFLSLALQLSKMRAKVDVTFGMLEKVLSENSDKSLKEIQSENDEKIDEFSDIHFENLMATAIKDTEQKELFTKYMKSKRNNSNK